MVGHDGHYGGLALGNLATTLQRQLGQVRGLDEHGGPVAIAKTVVPCRIGAQAHNQCLVTFHVVIATNRDGQRDPLLAQLHSDVAIGRIEVGIGCGCSFNDVEDVEILDQLHGRLNRESCRTTLGHCLAVSSQHQDWHVGHVRIIDADRDLVVVTKHVPGGLGHPQGFACRRKAIVKSLLLVLQYL